MTFDLGETIVIERPIAEVAAFVGDPSNTPIWSGRVDSAEWVTEPPITLGSQIVFRGRSVGRELVSRYEVVEYTPGEQVSMRTSAGTVPLTTTYTWRPVGDRVTHMTLRTVGEPSGFARLVAPFVARSLRRAMRRDLTDLQRLLERR